MSETRTRLGSQLKARRSRLGWTIADVAYRVNRQASRVSETETGKANSTIDSAADMGAVMGLSLVYVPTERLAEVMSVLDRNKIPTTTQAPSSVYDEVFIPDPNPEDEEC